MTESTEAAGVRVDGDLLDSRLHDYCVGLFATLPRADQRRSGEAYVRGLLSGQGRKSIRRIATQRLDGYPDQSLQQFVNQSPWDPQPVRQRVARLTADLLRPAGWVLEETVFPKHGRHSAAVDRQFVSSRGRVFNCQLAVSVLLANEDVSVPVHWLLSIPSSWDRDRGRRARARIPTDQRSRPFWRYQIEALDDMSGDWGIPAAPAIIDARACTELPDLLAEMDGRRLEYLVEASGTAAAQWRSGPYGPGRHGTLAELALLVPQQERRLVSWQEPARGRTMRAQVSLLPALSVADSGQRGAPASRAQRTLLVEWPMGKAEPRAFWITNMVDRSATELTALAKLRLRARHDLDVLSGRYGLCDYAGRSFPGWHHHVTLASIAFLFDTLHQVELADGAEYPVEDRPVGRHPDHRGVISTIHPGRHHRRRSP
jgi:hypothetical protein